MNSQAETAPLRGAALWAACGVVCLANLIVMLDLTIANVSIPHIASSLATAPVQGTWVITSYGAAEAVVVPLNGWLVRRFGAVRCFLTAMVGFGVFSALCGFATSFEMLVIFRVLQGLAGGPLNPLSQTLILHIFPPEKKATGLALWATAMLVGPSFGPILGGWLSDNYSWRWIFLINIPTAILCITLAKRLLRDQETATSPARADYIGLVLLAIWVTSLQVMLDRGRELAWFESPLIWMLTLITSISFFAFLIWEITDDHPIVDLRIFRNLRFSLNVVVQCISTAITFATIVVVPLWLQTALGFTAVQAGYVNALMGISSAAMGMIAGRLIAKFGPRVIALAGLILAALFALVRTQWTSGVDFWSIGLPMFLHGLVLPLFYAGLLTITMSTIDRKDNAAAVGAMGLFRTLAVPFSVAIVTTIWQNADQTSHAQIVNNLNASNADLSFIRHAGLTNNARLALIDRLVAKESLTLATIQIAWITASVFALLAVAAWIVTLPKRNVST